VATRPRTTAISRRKPDHPMLASIRISRPEDRHRCQKEDPNIQRAKDRLSMIALDALLTLSLRVRSPRRHLLDWRYPVAGCLFL
jgi:hypothetical protein